MKGTQGEESLRDTSVPEGNDPPHALGPNGQSAAIAMGDSTAPRSRAGGFGGAERGLPVHQRPRAVLGDAF